VSRRWVRIVTYVAGGLILVFALMQAVPYGRNHSDPPVIKEPQWPDAQTRQLAVAACFDCHSNQTVWRWYSDVAPFSWLVEADVVAGRHQVDFSEWVRPQDGSSGDPEQSLSGVVLAGTMPPKFYAIVHPSARLNEAERRTLALGLSKLILPQALTK
jgi:hypothetical protein